VTAAPWLAAAFGVAVALVSGVGVLAPQRLMGMLRWRWARGFGIGVRAVFGAVLLLAAPASGAPLALRILGARSLAAAIGLAAMGAERFQGLVGWWAERPPLFVRVWCVAGVLFGVFVAHAALA